MNREKLIKMYSGTTISYHLMQASNDQLTTRIFQLHIENHSKILRFLAAFLFFYFGLGIILDTYSLIDSPISTSNYLAIGMWIFKQLVNMLGIITSIFCVIASKLQSRGSSLKFSKMIMIFSEIYLGYLVLSFCLDFQSIYTKFNTHYKLETVDVIYFLICYVLVVGFFFKFFVGKAYQYHVILTQAILENTKQVLKGGIDGSIKF